MINWDRLIFSFLRNSCNKNLGHENSSEVEQKIRIYRVHDHLEQEVGSQVEHWRKSDEWQPNVGENARHVADVGVVSSDVSAAEAFLGGA